LRGSDELQEIKALNSINANDLIDVSSEELEQIGLIAGFMGPIDLPNNIKTVFDNSLVGGVNLVCGANEKDYHCVGLELKIDENATIDDIVSVKEGDRCIHCGGSLGYTKGIEVGHIFQLGTRYSEPLKAEFLDENGKTKPFVMGTYGIGVSRLLAAIIEQHHDEKGCKWTKESSPFEICIIVSNAKDEKQNEIAFKIYKELKEKNINVLIDDRNERFGFKMKDYELIGIPYAIIVGKKVEEDMVEFVSRDGDITKEVSPSNIIEAVVEIV
jgi:prolyl-tRNA synthetase